MVYTDISGTKKLTVYTDGYYDFEVDFTNFTLGFNRFTLGGQQSKNYNKYHTEGNLVNLTLWNTVISPENILYLAESSVPSSNREP